MAVKDPDNRIVFKVKSWLVHRTNKSPIPTEHMGAVEICPHLLLRDTLTLFYLMVADYVQHMGLSPLDLKMFRRV